MDRISARWGPYKCNAPQPTTCPASSSTMKSRTFSQISASVRGKSVPSVEYEPIKSWMRSASGSRASHLCMDLLVDRHDFFERRPPALHNDLWAGHTGNIVK